MLRCCGRRNQRDHRTDGTLGEQAGLLNRGTYDPQMIDCKFTSNTGCSGQVRGRLREKIKSLRSRIASELKVPKSGRILLMDGDRTVADEETVGSMHCCVLNNNSLQVIVILTGIETLGPELTGKRVKYLAHGVSASNGCIYFAPFGADRALCIRPADQAVFTVGPELPGLPKLRVGNSEFEMGDLYRAQGVRAPNGQIFFAPYNASYVLCIHPDGTAGTFGRELAGKAKYAAGGILAPNGCIYFAPCGAERVLCINPEMQTVVTIGAELNGSAKYVSTGVLARNGCIYYAPSEFHSFLCVNTGMQTVELLKPTGVPDKMTSSSVEGALKLLTTVSKYEAPGVMAPTGHIYFAPADADYVVGVDPEAQIMQEFGPPLVGQNKFVSAGVLADSGHIYFAPAGASRVLHLDPFSQTVGLIGPLLAPRDEPSRVLGWKRYVTGGVLASNGLYYFAPHDAEYVLSIDPASNAVAIVGGPISSRPQKHGRYSSDGALASDNCIYFAPNEATHALKIIPGTQDVEMVGPTLDGYSAGGAVAENGKIYFAPGFASGGAVGKVLCIDPPRSERRMMLGR